MLICCAERRERPGSETVYALLNYAVRSAYDIDMPAVHKLPGGKPVFPSRPDIHFSLSHARTHVLCAVADRPVGVDVETIRPVRAGVAERICTADELSAFDFFELWVLKESFLKLKGDPSVPVRQLLFSRNGNAIMAPDGTSVARLFDAIPGCTAAVCAADGIVPEIIEMVELP